MPVAVDASASRVLDVAGFDVLLTVLADDGFDVWGPVLGDDAIVLGRVRTVADLPQGWTDEQGPGHYRLDRTGDSALFGFVVGPHAPKRLLFPPHEPLWSSARTDGGVRVSVAPRDEHPIALVGARPCEVAAVEVLDRVLRERPVPDRTYVERRDALLVVAVNCARPAATCFCASMGTGPHGAPGADLELTELVAPSHRFLAVAHSERGRDLLARLPTTPADDADVQGVDDQARLAAEGQVRAIDLGDLPEVLDASLEHPRWDDVAARCLACANCTLVCPTCFCHDVDDRVDLSGDRVERWRHWDSCFTLGFSELHGGSVRSSIRSRYRQWLTHKLGTWVEQFGTSGCVGCGRCITWCPVGIDLTDEVRALRAEPGESEP